MCDLRFRFISLSLFVNRPIIHRHRRRLRLSASSRLIFVLVLGCRWDKPLLNVYGKIPFFCNSQSSQE